MFRSLGHGGQENFCKCHDRGITPRNQICPVRSYSYHIWNCAELVLLSSSVLRETAIMASRILQDECSHWFSYKWFLLLLQYWSMKLKISRIYCNIPACFREREREKVAIVLSAWAWFPFGQDHYWVLRLLCERSGWEVSRTKNKSFGPKLHMQTTDCCCFCTLGCVKCTSKFRYSFKVPLYFQTRWHCYVDGRDPEPVDMVVW